MKLKKGLKNCSSDPWYDLSNGGYLNPMEMCESEEDAKKVVDAVDVVQDFLRSCDEQIDDFLM